MVLSRKTVMNFTYNNHLKYSIGDNLFGFRSNPLEKFLIDVGSIDKQNYYTTNFRKELSRIADIVYNDFGKEFALFVSGGTDSEIVLRNFLSIGVTPACFTIRFDNDYNIDDVAEAHRIANELGIHLREIPLDIKEFFFSGEADEISKRLACSQITYLMVYHCIEKLSMPSIMGGEVLLKRNVSKEKTQWVYNFRENEDASAMRFSRITGIPLVNEWFSYTPEILLLYLEQPEIVKLISEKFNYKLSSVSTKNIVLTRLFPEIRLRKKTHGFEKLIGFNTEVNKILSKNLITSHGNNIDGIEYFSLKEKLYGL